MNYENGIFDGLSILEDYIDQWQNIIRDGTGIPCTDEYSVLDLVLAKIARIKRDAKSRTVCGNAALRERNYKNVF